MQNVLIAARVEVELKALVEKVSKSRGEGVSTFVRRAIRKELAELSFLSAEDRKALGLVRGGSS
jgi:predicted DNA-binding protein